MLQKLEGKLKANQTPKNRQNQNKQQQKRTIKKKGKREEKNKENWNIMFCDTKLFYSREYHRIVLRQNFLLKWGMWGQKLANILTNTKVVSVISSTSLLQEETEAILKNGDEK